MANYFRSIPDKRDKTEMDSAIVVQSPGRINLIGEHTDYNDGFVLPAAIDKKTTIHLSCNGDLSSCWVKAANLDQDFSFDLNSYAPMADGWQNYIMGVVHELQQLGGDIKGFNCNFSGDVPIGSGMSSSAALECSLAFGLNELFHLGFDKEQLIKAAQMAEHHFVGTKCGIMDQFASMMGKKDQVILLDCRTLEYQYFPLALGDYQLLLLNTNVSHSLASSEYNTRRKECEEGVAIIREKLPEIKNLRDIQYSTLVSFAEEMPEKIFKRCRHIVTENQRVLEATKALSDSDFDLLGKLIYESHHSLQHDYEVSCPELDFLVQQTLDKAYILGARMMGGGFGGCTINIISKADLEAFVEEITKIYHEKFNLNLTPYTVSIEDGTGLVEH